MTFAPLFYSPCDLAQRIPSMVADFLELENKVGRRFREDSVTDIIIASLLKVAGSNATVLVPPETRTGGDFDIVIVEPSTGDAIQYRIQAKRLSTHPTEWTWGSYRELDHPHGQGIQSSTLIKSSSHEKITTIPLYAFYNPYSACHASGGAIGGIELADGVAINQIVKVLVKAKSESKRPRLKRIAYLRDLFFPLSTLLCPPSLHHTVGAAIVAPRISRAAVEAAMETRRRPQWMWSETVEEDRKLIRSPRRKLQSRLGGSEEAMLLERTSVPDKRYPEVIKRAISRATGEDPIQVARVKRPKIVLISAAPA